MSRFSSFLLGVVTGASLLYGAMHYHLIRSSEGFDLVPKQSARLSETYLDIRSYTLADWSDHPLAAAALVQANKQHLLGDGAAATLQQKLGNLLPQRPAN